MPKRQPGCVRYDWCTHIVACDTSSAHSPREPFTCQSMLNSRIIDERESVIYTFYTQWNTACLPGQAHHMSCGLTRGDLGPLRPQITTWGILLLHVFHVLFLLGHIHASGEHTWIFWNHDSALECSVRVEYVSLFQYQIRMNSLIASSLCFVVLMWWARGQRFQEECRQEAGEGVEVHDCLHFCTWLSLLLYMTVFTSVHDCLYSCTWLLH